jgi:flagellar motor switch protein FliG
MALFFKKRVKAPPADEALMLQRASKQEVSTDGFSKITKTMPLPEKQAQEIPEESRTRRVAKFLVLIGAEQASKILAQLDESQIEAVSKEIARIHSIRTDEAEAILKEFNDLFKNNYGYGGVSAGGAETARRLLYSAFGPNEGEKVFKRATAEKEEQPFDFLADLAGEQVALILRDESPATQAMILSRLPPKLAAQVLAREDGGKKVDIAKRIAQGGSVSPEVLNTVSQALKEKARKIGADKQPGEKIDGMGTLASILRYSDVSFGDKLIRNMEVEDPSLGEGLKARLYTLDDIPKAEDKALQDKLRDMTEHNIAVLLRERNDAFKKKIFSNVSSQRRAVIAEEDEVMGPVPRKEANVVVDDFMAWFRNGRENGSIMMNDDEDIIV